MAAAAVKKVNSAPRGSDRKKASKTWLDVKVVQEYEGGYYLGYIDHPDDLATLGKLMGHCSGTHFIWACEEKTWYFFALFDKDDVPHGTLHAKQTKWLNVPHPRDSGPPMTTHKGYCPTCNGTGGKYDQFYSKFEPCKKCKGSGNDPNPPKGMVGQIRPSSGGYATFADVLEAFKAAGVEYEPGKYGPISYNSTTYDTEAQRDYSSAASFDNLYGDVFGGKKPEGISEELWTGYVKTFKAIKDEYNKNNGFIKIAGRTFKFDGKDLTVLSFADKSHRDSKTLYRKQIAEFLNNHQKAKKEETA